MQFDPILDLWGSVDLSNLDKLKQVTIHSYGPSSTCEVIKSLPLHIIDLLLVVNPLYVNPKLDLEDWKNLDNALVGYNLGRSVDDPLPFYVVSETGYEASHMDCRTALPKFTNREVVRVDQSLLRHLRYSDVFDQVARDPSYS